MNDITNAVETLDPARIAAALADEHVADIVERLNAEPVETASAVLLAMPLERAAEVSRPFPPIGEPKSSGTSKHRPAINFSPSWMLKRGSPLISSSPIPRTRREAS
jgi:hypothetical protein